jgi:hypothetical protein
MEILATLAGSSAEHATTFLGEDRNGWMIALIVALPAALIYEVIMAATRKITLRIPFLILRAGRLVLPKQAWTVEYPEWRAELWATLHEEGRSALVRFARAIRWATSVTLHARQTARADARTELRPYSRTRLVVATIAHTALPLGTVLHSPTVAPLWEEVSVVCAYAFIVPMQIILLKVSRWVGLRDTVIRKVLLYGAYVYRFPDPRYVRERVRTGQPL